MIQLTHFFIKFTLMSLKRGSRRIRRYSLFSICFSSSFWSGRFLSLEIFLTLAPVPSFLNKVPQVMNSPTPTYDSLLFEKWMFYESDAPMNPYHGYDCCG